MKAVKYTSFEDLKASDKKNVDNKVKLKRHNDFEKVVKDISYAKVYGAKSKGA